MTQMHYKLNNFRSNQLSTTNSYNIIFRFEETLSPLPQIPEMTFDRNTLRVMHREGFGLEFNALDALKLVDAHNDHMKVAVSETWTSTRLVTNLKSISFKRVEHGC